MKQEQQSNPQQGEQKIKEFGNSKQEKRRSQEEEEKRRVRISRISVHPSNPHRGSFTVKEDVEFIVINKVVNSSTFHSYILAEEIQQGSQTNFRLRQQRTKNRYLMIGIGSKSAFGLENPQFHPETFCFSSYKGQLWELGTDKIISSPVNDGSMFDISVDLKQNTVSWKVDENLQTVAKIPAKMRSVPLFLYILMFNVGDEVHLFL